MAEEIIEYEKLIAQRKAEVEKKAKDYLANKKERKTYYSFIGTSFSENNDGEISVYLRYTQDEINHLIQLFIDLFNEGIDDESDKVSKLSEIDIPLIEFEGSNPDIDELLNRCYNCDVNLKDIDPTPHYFYKMSCFGWNSRRKELSKPTYFSVDLTDEEYLYLLTQQLGTRYNCPPFFSYNDLVFENPKLAHHINLPADAAFLDGETCLHQGPFFVIFDEVIDDVIAIEGPESEYDELYSERGGKNGDIIDNDEIVDANDVRYLYHVLARTFHRELEIEEEVWPSVEPEDWTDHRFLEHIDADKVMNLLGVTDYIGMIEKLKEKFNSRTAFKDIKAWLEESNLDYKYKAEPNAEKHKIIKKINNL